jgi:WD40 repeat protein
VWRPDAGKPEQTLLWKGSMLALACPDGQYLCHGNQDATVHFWIVRSAKELHMWGYPTKVRELSWDRRSRYLATGGGADVTVWDCSGRGPANTKPIVLSFHEELLSQVVYQRNGPLLASGCTGGRIAVWNPGKGKSKEPIFTAALSSGVTQLSWSPDGEYLAAASEEGTPAVYQTGKLTDGVSR